MTDKDSGQIWTVNSDYALESFILKVRELYREKKYIRFKWSTGSQATEKQKKALHVFCRLLAEELNNRGLDMKTVLNPGIEIPWDEGLVKENLWRPLQIAMTKHSSTNDLERDQCGEIHCVLMRKLAELGVYVEWPHLPKDKYQKGKGNGG